MLGRKVLLAINAPVNTKMIQWGVSQGSVQANGVPPHLTCQTLALWTSIYC